MESRSTVSLAVAMAVGLAAAPAALDALEAGMYGTTDWTTACPANDLSHWDNMVDQWYNRIDDFGWYSQDYRWVDGSISNRPLCDPDKGSGCSDGVSLDDKDAVMVFGHGSDLGDHWGMVMRNTGCGGSCWIEHPGATDKSCAMYAGDLDAEFVHLSSCNSMDDDNLPETWRAFRDPIDTPVNGARLHQMDGFHGYMWIGSSLDSNYREFAEDAFWMSIKSAWLYNHYETNINGAYYQCPVAYAVGANSTDCFTRIGNERYNYIYGDPSSIGYYCYFFYAGCDPEGETAFVDPNS
jgi:hypothetical protein